MSRGDKMGGGKIGYKSEAVPKATTADGIPVFCAHDEVCKTETLVPNPRNPNRHSEEQVELLAKIIESTGWRQPITVSRLSGFVVKGHGRLLAARRRGWGEVPVDYQEYTSEAEEWADLVADNRLAELSEMDDGALLALLDEVGGSEIPVDLTGFSNAEIAEIEAAFAAANGAADSDVDDVKYPPQNPVIQPGDLILMGGHRLLCGDSRSERDVARLMDGQRAAMVFTDPPYGVSYDNPNGTTKGEIKGDDLRGDSLRGFLQTTFENLAKFTDDDGAFYIWHASNTVFLFLEVLDNAGLEQRTEIIWVKNNFQLGRAGYQHIHEPCFYASKKGHRPRFYGDRTGATVWKVTLRSREGNMTAAGGVSVEEDKGEVRGLSSMGGGVTVEDEAAKRLYVDAKPPKGKKVRTVRLAPGKSLYLYNAEGNTTSTVWEVARDTNYRHPTQKPVELATRAILNSSQPGEIVLDLFGGSGSTLRGAEVTGRRCYMCEIFPAYCDVITDSYIELSGDADVKVIRDGKEYSYVDLAFERGEAIPDMDAWGDESEDDDEDDPGESE